MILGPTLLDLSNRVGVGISELAAILLVRSVGSVFGSVGSGFVCDHYQKASLWMLNANIFALALCTYIYIYIYIIYVHMFKLFSDMCTTITNSCCCISSDNVWTRSSNCIIGQW